MSNSQPQTHTDNSDRINRMDRIAFFTAEGAQPAKRIA